MGYETDTAGTLVDKRAEIIRIGVGRDEKMIQRYSMCADSIDKNQNQYGDWVFYTDHIAALAEKEKQHKWEHSHMQILRNECYKIIEFLHKGSTLTFPCGDKDVEAAPTRAIEQITALTAENADLRKCIEDEAVKIFRNENTALTIENKRLRQIVIDCHAGWPDEVLQKALQGEEGSHEPT